LIDFFDKPRKAESHIIWFGKSTSGGVVKLRERSKMAFDELSKIVNPAS